MTDVDVNGLSGWLEAHWAAPLVVVLVAFVI